MSVDFQPALEQIFGALGHDATYIPAVGDPRTITVLPKQPDTIIGIEGSRTQTASTCFEVMTSAVVAFAKNQDMIIFNDITYIVQNARIKDDLKLVWLVDTYPA